MYITPVYANTLNSTNLTILERLIRRKADIESDLERVNAAIELVKANPDFANIVESLRFL